LQPTPETRKAHDDNVRFHRTWGFIGIGAGVAIAGASVVYAAVASSDKSKAQQDFDANQKLVIDNVGDCKQGAETIDQCNARLLDAQDRVNSAGNRRTLGFIGVGVGAAVAATGVIILVTGESSHRFDAPEASGSSAKRARSGGIALLPGPGQFGLALGGAF
jgi:hypothetical protein